MELGIGLARDLPVAHIAVIGAIDLAYGFFLNCNALHGLDCNHGRHTYASAGLDGSAEG